MWAAPASTSASPSRPPPARCSSRPRSWSPRPSARPPPRRGPGRAGIDVYVTEPATSSPRCELPQVVVAPHLGASTAEAQDRAGTDVARSVARALAGEFVPDAVNVQVSGQVGEEVRPWLPLVRKL